MKVVELFAGNRSIGKECDKRAYKCFSVDWGDFDGIDLKIDIEDMTRHHVPFVPDAVWGSPDCSTYSIAACSTHREGSVIPKTDYAKKCDRVNQHVIKMVKEWLVINPNMVFFFENPRGMMRKKPWMQEFKRHTVWYCQYGDTRAKPTDIWTNSQSWKPRKECFNGNPNCHHERAPRGSKTGTQGLKGSFNRSKIPQELCSEIIDSLTASQLKNFNKQLTLL